MSHVDQGLAFLFPGQGSQSVGMLSELAASHPVVGSTLNEASAVLGYDLQDLVFNGPEERLNSTLFTQPAMLAAGVAAWRVWCDVSEVRPAWMAGHSLGEYTALVCAGALDFSAGLRLVSERARLMQEAVPAGAGAMAAILGLSDDQVASVCAEASTAAELVTPANFNSPGQVVIAGDSAAVGRAAELARSAGAKRAVLLPVSVPSHCSLMKPAAEEFRQLLDAVSFAGPSVQILHNVDVATHVDANGIRIALEQQLYGSVRWTETVASLSDRGVTRFIECGPGRVLASLNKRISKLSAIESIYDCSSLANAEGLVQ